MRVGLAIALLWIVAACMPAPAPTATTSSPSLAPTDLASASRVSRFMGSPTMSTDRPRSSTDARCRSAVSIEGTGPAVAVNAEVRGCFLGAYRDGTGAEYASIQMTIEGDPIATIMRTLSGGGVELLIDSTQDQYGEDHWRRITCRTIVIDPRRSSAPTDATRAHSSKVASNALDGGVDMLADSMLVTTVAVTDLDQAKAFYRDRLGLRLLDEQPFAIRFGAGKGTQVSVRRGQPNVDRRSATSRSTTSRPSFAS